MKNIKQILGYLHAKKQHAKAPAMRAMYSELLETAKLFPSQILETVALIKLIGA